MTRPVSFLIALSLIVSVPALRAAESLDRTVRTLSLEEKIGQMIMTSFVGTKLTSRNKRFFDELKPGGITMFSYNIRNPDQLRRLNADLNEYITRNSAGITPFIAIDQEGGLVTRVREQVAVLPGNMLLGATRSPELAMRAGSLLGKGLHDYGFNMNLAPVLDINSNPQNPVIGLRSYSSNANLVSKLGGAFIQGLQRHNVIAVGKHFPGHGDSFGDSHARLPVVKQDMQMLSQRELVPFRYAFENAGLDVVMTAHIALPAIHNNRRIPVTVSPIMLTRTLRQQIGFKGVIMTDGLEMKGLLRTIGNLGRAAVMAVNAGADVLTINADPGAARQIKRALLKAVRRGDIKPSRIDQSVRRILMVKQRHGLLSGKQRVQVPDAGALRSYRDIAREIANNGVTIVRNRNRSLPVLASSTRTLWFAGDKINLKRYQHMFSGMRVKRASLESYNDVLSLARQLRDRRSVVVVMAHSRKTILQAEQLAARSRGKVILVNTGSPYLVRKGIKVDAILCTYSRMSAAVTAAVEVIAGRRGAPGRLPVQLSRRYPYGYPGGMISMNSDQFAEQLNEHITKREREIE